MLNQISTAKICFELFDVDDQLFLAYGKVKLEVLLTLLFEPASGSTPGLDPSITEVKLHI